MTNQHYYPNQYFKGYTWRFFPRDMSWNDQVLVCFLVFLPLSFLFLFLTQYILNFWLFAVGKEESVRKRFIDDYVREHPPDITLTEQEMLTEFNRVFPNHSPFFTMQNVERERQRLTEAKIRHDAEEAYKKVEKKLSYYTWQRCKYQYRCVLSACGIAVGGKHAVKRERKPKQEPKGRCIGYFPGPPPDEEQDPKPRRRVRVQDAEYSLRDGEDHI